MHVKQHQGSIASIIHAHEKKAHEHVFIVSSLFPINFTAC